MNKETNNLQQTVCEFIKPHDEFVDKPYKCSLDYLCMDVFQYAGESYCGRMLRLQRDEETQRLKFKFEVEIREYNRR